MNDMNNVPAAREQTLLERIVDLEQWREKAAIEMDTLRERLAAERERVDRVLGSEIKPLGWSDKR